MLFKRFEAGDVRAHEAVLEALKEEELVFFDWTTDGDSRSCGADAKQLSIAPARSWQDAREQVAPVVAAGSCFDRRHCARELPVLRSEERRVGKECRGVS